MKRLLDLSAKDPRRVLGLTSGSSADGVDAALLEIAGSGREARWALRIFHQRSYPPELRDELLEIFDAGRARLEDLVALETRLGEEFAAAGVEALEKVGFKPGQLDLVGTGGQALWHSPPSQVGRERAGTWQAGNPMILAERLLAPVVHDFRSRDIAVGGEGAPLGTCINCMLLSDEKVGRLVLGLGGVASLTYLPPAAPPERTLAFHAGPANLVLDEIVRATSGGERQFDPGGTMAAAGTVSRQLLEELIGHPFFRRPPPRSTGRGEFGSRYAVALLGKARRLGLSEADLLATTAALAARAVGDAVKEHILPLGPVDEVVAHGGGVRNATLMEMIRRALPRDAEVLPSDHFGLPAEAKEAMTVAFLANETVAGHTGNLPGATGASRAVILGSLVP